MGLTMTRVECASRVSAFDNLCNDSSPDIRETPLPKRVGAKRAYPPPSVSSEFLFCSFALSPRALMTVLQMLPGLRLWRTQMKMWNAACSG
jgi:hypothetical protein